MKTGLGLAMVACVAGMAFAEPVELMTRYVITTSRVNQLTGAVTSESRDAKLVRTKLVVSKHTQEGKAYLAFTAQAGEGTDVSDEAAAVVDFEKQSEVLATIKDAQTRMAKAAMGIKTGESSEVLWTANERLSLTLYTQTKTPRAFLELQVESRIYVLRTGTEIEKLLAAIKAVK